MNNLESKVILVTGATQGIGQAVAKALLEDGHHVVLAARSAEALDKIAQRYPDQALPVTTDVSDPEAVEHLYAQIRDIHGRLDVLFNNAGAFMASSEIGNVSWEELRGNWVSTQMYGAQQCTYTRTG